MFGRSRIPFCGTRPGERRYRNRRFRRRAAGSAFAAALLPALTVGAAPAPAQSWDFTPEQLDVARVVYQVGREVRASERAMLAAFEAGLVESEMRASPQPCEKDHDSAGAFQQRRDWVPSDRAPRSKPDWCTIERDPRLLPRWAATGFFRGSGGHPGALHYDEHGADSAGRKVKTAGQLAQATQVSAYPERYDQRESQAQALLHLVSRRPVQMHPYTPEEICGAGYSVIDWTLLRDSGYVFLLWSKDSRQNCVTTVKISGVGTPTTMNTYLQPDGGSPSDDSGRFGYYAGPVKAIAPSCIKWGGSIERDRYDSPASHCSS